MSDQLRVTGMFSGIDTESIVSQLVEAKSTKVTELKNEQKKLEWTQTAWQDLNSKIYNLYHKTLSNLRLSSTYTQKTTTCSDTTKATVIASSDAVDGTQTLSVNKLAKSGYLTGAKLAAKTESDGTTSTWTTSDELSDISSSLVGTKISVTTGTGDDATTTEIELTSSMTISDLVTQLKSAGVSASFDESNQRFFINSTSTGAASDFTLGGDTDSLAALGLTTDSGAVKVEGQDAEIVLNGATFTSSTNTFTVNGLTINTLGVTDEEVSIVTSVDIDGIYDTIKDFFTEYNELINEMDKLYNADSARDYDMLTDEEEESMTDDEIESWNDKIKSALLRKDTSLGSIMNSMINTMLEGYEGADGKTHYLSEYGISTLSYFEAEDNEHHAYHIDGDEDDDSTSSETDKLKTAIASDPEGVATFFSNLCKALYDTIDDTMSTRTDYKSIYKVYNDKQLQDEYDDYTDKIEEAEDELSDYEDKWYDKFTSMETALSKLQSAQSTISSMLGS